jgi:hypothetical protein
MCLPLATAPVRGLPRIDPETDGTGSSLSGSHNAVSAQLHDQTPAPSRSAAGRASVLDCGQHWLEDLRLVLTSAITDDCVQDPFQVPDLLAQVDGEIDRFVADDIYDREPVYVAVLQHSPGCRITIPPRKDAVLSGTATVSPSQRDVHVASIQNDGRQQWKRESGYYQQSHAENAFFRYKTIIGGRLRAKRTAAQEREAAIGCAVLNRMLEFGRPQSYSVS